MDTILETNAAVESVRQAYDGGGRPRPGMDTRQVPAVRRRSGQQLLLCRRPGIPGLLGMLELARRQPGLHLRKVL